MPYAGSRVLSNRHHKEMFPRGEALRRFVFTRGNIRPVHRKGIGRLTFPGTFASSRRSRSVPSGFTTTRNRFTW